MAKKVFIKKPCSLCDDTGKDTDSCGGDRMDMYNCYIGDCGIKHKEIDCYWCKGKGFVKEEAEMYDGPWKED